jgi:UDP-glucose 4-epimerase
LAANSDIPAGVLDPSVDLKNTFLTTFEILRSMKKYNIKTIHFASSSAIYGDLGEILINENIGPLLPISNYGAMKLASEAQISAACENFLERANVFRFPNVVGIPATHGVILDFVLKLKNNKDQLDVLGDGTQQKAYLHVSDLIDAMLVITKQHSVNKILIVNIGPIDEGVTVNWIANQVIKRTNPKAIINYGTGNKGWIGDVPKFNYSTSLLQSFGWNPKLGSCDAVIKAIDEILLNI